MAITIKDVARVANVSTTTVSKVINRNPTISEETTRHVLEVIKKLNYTPNLRARSFASKKTMIVAFVTHIKPNLAFINPHFFEIMVGSQRYLSNHQYQMVFVGIRKNEIETSIKHIVDSKGVDGIIVHVSAITPEVAKYLVKTNFPHVVIGMPDFPTNVCWIDNNNELSGELAAKHLFDIDKTKIAYLAGSKNDLISETRKKGVEKEMAEHYYKLKPEYTIFTDSTYDESYEATRKLMSIENKPNAIICANNTINLACINSLTDMGYKIPEDVAVITFDDYPYATITKPPTTAISIDVYDLGKQAAYFLVKKIKKPNYQFQTYVTVPLLMIRESTQIDK